MGFKISSRLPLGTHYTASHGSHVIICLTPAWPSQILKWHTSVVTLFLLSLCPHTQNLKHSLSTHFCSVRFKNSEWTFAFLLPNLSKKVLDTKHKMGIGLVYWMLAPFKRERREIELEKERRKDERKLKKQQREEEQKRKTAEKARKATERQALKAKREAAEAEKESSSHRKGKE